MIDLGRVTFGALACKQQSYASRLTVPGHSLQCLDAVRPLWELLSELFHLPKFLFNHIRFSKKLKFFRRGNCKIMQLYVDKLYGENSL